MRSNKSLRASLFAFVFASALSFGCGPAGKGEEGQTSSGERSLTAQWENQNLCERNGNGVEKFAICHIPDEHETGVVLCLPEPAIPAHIGPLGHARDCFCDGGNCQSKHDCSCDNIE